MLSLGFSKFSTPTPNVWSKAFNILPMVESHGHNELKKPETKEFILDDSINMKFKYR